MDKKKVIILLILLVIIDQIIKTIIYNFGILNSNYFITPLLNKGISFGIELFHFNLLIIIIPIILASIYYMYKNEEISPIAFALIFAGGLGNFIDRIIFFGVRDFIDLHFFPVFNTADIFISLGFIIIIFNLIQPKSKGI